MSTLEELRAQLDHEVSELGKIEDALQYQNARLGKLHGGYLSVIRDIIQIHDRNLFPLAGYRNMLEDQIDFLTTRMEWAVLKIKEIEKNPEISEFELEYALEPCALGALEDARKGLRDAYERFDSECSPASLYVLMNTSAPSTLALETLRIVAHILGEEDDSWDATRVLLTSNYFLEFFRRRSDFLMKQRDALSPSLLLEIDIFCRDVAHSQYALYDDNVCLGVLGEWIRAVWNYYRCLYITAPILIQDKSRSNVLRIKDTLEPLTFGELSPMPTIQPRLLLENNENEKRKLAWGAPPKNADAESPPVLEDSVLPEGESRMIGDGTGSAFAEEEEVEPTVKTSSVPPEKDGIGSSSYLDATEMESEVDKTQKVKLAFSTTTGERNEGYLEGESSKKEEALAVPSSTRSPARPMSIFHEMVRPLEDPDIVEGPTKPILEELKALLEWRDHLEQCAQEVEGEIEKEEELITTEIRETQEGYDEDMLPIQEEFEALVRDFVEQYVDTRNTGKKFYWYLNQEEAGPRKQRRRYSMLNEASS